LFGYLDETNRMNTQGVGLGLYITKMIVSTFDGTVSLESELGVGSTFGFTFRLSEDQIDVDDIQRDVNPHCFWSKEKIVLNMKDL
jgi:signal transduction histidine kinase